MPNSAATTPALPVLRHWSLAVFSMELRRMLSYRMDFWTQFLGSLVAQFGVAWFLWKAVFAMRGVAEIGGYSFAGMMLYYIAAPLAARLVQGAEMGGISDEIYNGTLTRYLVYPVSFFGHKLATAGAHVLIFALQFALVFGVATATAGLPAEFAPTPATVAAGFLTLVLAAYLNFVLVATIELIAFWADNVWSLVVVVRFLTGLLGGALLPLSLFPDWARDLLYRLPFAYLVSFPVEILLGVQPLARWGHGLLMLALWATAGTVLLQLVWWRGRRQYTGVGI